MKQGNRTVNAMRPNLTNGLASAAVILSLSACGSDTEEIGINISTNDDGGVVISIDDDGVVADDDGAVADGAVADDDGVADDNGAVADDDAGDLVAGACPLVGNLQSLELATDRTWFLEGALQIGSGETAATLDIEGGTQIRGDNQDVTDYVLVYPGSSLNANGTGTNPVHFLSDDDDVDGSGEWGGVFLRGFNGLSAEGTQGSNRLDYVVVAEAGAAVEVTIDAQTVTYTDNLVLNGVDSTTTLTFVQSHNSARDGLHILNGDPRLSWILTTGSARDGIWYRDFNGLIKDLMVIHNPDIDGSTGRSGIYASETEESDSNPRIVNATLVGRDSTSVSAGASDNEFGILFADNTDQIRMANVLIANFRNGCFEADTAADLSQIDTTVPGPNYIDGVHCANEAGANFNFGVVRDGSTGFPGSTIGPANLNVDGVIYYNGAGPELPVANTTFDSASGGLNFTGELVDRTENFTAGWYLDNLRGIGNGLAGNADFLNGFLDGDTNNDGVVDAADTASPFIISDDGEGGFNQDVADDTFGYDLTHIGAVRGGAITNTQFDNWTVDTGPLDPFTVQINPANL